jgi:hypothetical protein
MNQERPDNSTRMFVDEFGLKQYIDQMAGVIQVSSVPITSSDIQFFKDGEIRFDIVNNKLYIRAGDRLITIIAGTTLVSKIIAGAGVTIAPVSGIGDVTVSVTTPVTSTSRGGSGSATAILTTVTFSTPMADATYGLYLFCYNGDVEVGKTTPVRSANGFTFTPLEDCSYWYVATKG